MAHVLILKVIVKRIVDVYLDACKQTHTQPQPESLWSLPPTTPFSVITSTQVDRSKRLSMTSLSLSPTKLLAHPVSEVR